MLPHVDEFRPVHNLESLAGLIAALGAAPASADKRLAGWQTELRKEKTMSDALDVLDQVGKWKASGKGVALATVITTWGSSPRPVGSQLGVDDTGAMVGSVSGGCIEGAVVKEALASIADGKPRLLDFGVTDEQAWDVGLACGGKVQVFVEKVN